MKKAIFLLAASFIYLSIPSCKTKEGCTDLAANNYDSDAERDDSSCTYTSGTGGEITIAAFPKHHEMPIVSDSMHLDSAFVKFNTSNSPGVSSASYDLIIAGEPGENHVHITGLKRGKYFIYMTGWDTTGQGQRVKGGIPYEIKQKSGEIDLVVPVSE